MSEWKPIESAPNDRWIMLYAPNPAHPNRKDLTHWIGRWGWSVSYLDGGWFDQDDCLVVEDPTHWRDLPPPPESE